MKLYTDRKRIRAAIQAAQLKATTSVAAFRAAVEVPYLRIRAAVGRFVIPFYFTENTVVLSLARVFFGRGTVDSAEVTDFPVVVPGKKPLELLGVAEALDPFQISKPFFENPKVEEATYFAEDYTSTDYTVTPFQIELHKAHTDSAAIIDSPVIAPGKKLASTAGVFDGVLSKQIVAATSGVVMADVADIAAAYLIRSLTNTARIQEIPTATLNTGVTDTGAAADTALWTLVSATDDAVTAADTDVLRAIKTFFDGSLLLDDNSTDVSKALTDAVGISATSTQVFSLGASDAGAAADSNGLQASKELTDTGVVGDSVLVSRLRFLFPLDTSTVADSSTRVRQRTSTDLGTMVDSVALTLPRAASDSGAAADSVALTPNLGIVDTAAVSEGGSLRAQGYCAFDYFAEDYVGTALTF